MPTQSDNPLRMDAELPFLVPKHIEPCGLEEKNTVNVRMPILKGLENSTARHCSKLLSSISHESIELYTDVLNTVGNSPNIVQFIAVELLMKNKEKLEKHKQKWTALRNITEEWLRENDLEYFPNKIGITYLVNLSIKDTYKWTNELAIPHHSLAAVPETFFLFKRGYKRIKSNKIRLGLGNIDLDKTKLAEAFGALENALRTY